VQDVSRWLEVGDQTPICQLAHEPQGLRHVPHHVQNLAGGHDIETLTVAEPRLILQVPYDEFGRGHPSSGAVDCTGRHVDANQLAAKSLQILALMAFGATDLED
jgi:hypothetical protein